jgi:heptosyltransferase III
MIGSIIISRTDKIGDVILTLPVAAVLKEQFPGIRVIFLGNSYTKPVLQCSPFIDEIVEWDKLMSQPDKERIHILKNLNADAILHVFPERNIASAALKAGIPLRIGTSHRIYHWLNCNTLLNISRKNSSLHETQLNLKLLKPLGIDVEYTPQSFHDVGLLSLFPEAEEKTMSFIDSSRINIIFHPCSKGSAREWPLEHYAELCNLLPQEKFNIIFAGTESEAQKYRPFLNRLTREIKDAGGIFSLSQYIVLISRCDGLVAASTGPLHIAAACGIHAFGIYPPIRPMHPGRWAPLGKKSHVLVKNIECSQCRKTLYCECMKEILPEQLKTVIMRELLGD